MFFVEDEEMTRQVFVLITERIVETGVRFAEWRIVRVLLNCEKRQVFVLITRQRVCVCVCVFLAGAGKGGYQTKAGVKGKG